MIAVSRRLTFPAGPILLLAVLSALALFARPLTPIDETRYVGVAWEMWLKNEYLVLFKNGEPYSHKPPLLFWLVHAGWAVFGVNDTWPRLIPVLCGAATVGVTTRIALRLWPDAPQRAMRAAWILAGAMLFGVFTQVLMFDMLLARDVSQRP